MWNKQVQIAKSLKIVIWDVTGLGNTEQKYMENCMATEISETK
jgi:hypothetical protein